MNALEVVAQAAVYGLLLWLALGVACAGVWASLVLLFDWRRSRRIVRSFNAWLEQR